ncbi:MAG: acyl-homoserine-lactone synthase [Parvibaculaceae bacterium]
MFYVIDRENRHLYEDQLDQMFRLRKKIFVDEKGWDMPVRDGWEIDQFDTDDADYVLFIDDGGNVKVGLRYMPYCVPNMTKDVFGHLLYEEPDGANVYEMTRAFITQDVRDGTYFPLLLCAKYEYLLWKEASHIIEVCDTRFLPMLLETGWHMRVVGRPEPDESGVHVPIMTPVNQTALDLPRRRFGIDKPVLYRVSDASREGLPCRAA